MEPPSPVTNNLYNYWQNVFSLAFELVISDSFRPLGNTVTDLSFVRSTAMAEHFTGNSLTSDLSRTRIFAIGNYSTGFLRVPDF